MLLKCAGADNIQTTTPIQPEVPPKWQRVGAATGQGTSHLQWHHTCQASGDVDLGVLLPCQRAEGRDAVDGCHTDGVVGVRQQVHQGDSPPHEPCLLWHKAHAAAALLAAAPQRRRAAATPQAVGQVAPAARVRRGTPLQHQRRLPQAVDQVPRGGGRTWKQKSVWAQALGQLGNLWLLWKQQHERG